MFKIWKHIRIHPEDLIELINKYPSRKFRFERLAWDVFRVFVRVS